MTLVKRGLSNGPTVQLNIRISPVLKKKLEYLAKVNTTTIADVVVQLVDREYEECEQEEEKTQSVPDRVIDTEFSQERRLEPVRRKSQAFRG